MSSSSMSKKCSTASASAKFYATRSGIFRTGHDDTASCSVHTACTLAPTHIDPRSMESTGSYEELDSSVKEHLDIATFQVSMYTNS